MSYTFESVLPEGDSLRRVQELVRLLGYRRRKTTLYESIEALVESRNAFVDAGQMNVALYDKQLETTLTDIVEAVDGSYEAIGRRFGFAPIKDY